MSEQPDRPNEFGVFLMLLPATIAGTLVAFLVLSWAWSRWTG
jgi:hypothetical protein